MELSNPKSWRKHILRSMSVGRHIPMATFNCQSCGSRIRKVFFRRDAKLLSSEFEIAQKRRMKRAWNVWHWLWRQRRGNFLLAQKPKNIRPDSYIYHIVSTFYLVLLFLSFSLSLSFTSPGIISGRTTCHFHQNVKSALSGWIPMCQGFDVSQLRHQLFSCLIHVFFVESIQLVWFTVPAQNYVCWLFPSLRLSLMPRSLRKWSTCPRILSYAASISTSEGTILTKTFFNGFIFGFWPPLQKSNQQRQIWLMLCCATILLRYMDLAALRSSWIFQTF